MFARKAGLIVRSGSELETRHLSVLVPVDKNVHAYPSVHWGRHRETGRPVPHPQET